jgi:hypothetical protein
MSDKESKEFIDHKAEEKEYNKVKLKHILSGKILVKDLFIKQLPYILFLTLIAVVYISNRYSSEKTLRESIKLEAELKELKAKSMIMAAELTKASRQSEVINMVETNQLELKEAKIPPQRIKLRD